VVAPVDPNGYQHDEGEALRLVEVHLGGVLTEDWRPFRDKDWHGVRDRIGNEVVRWKPPTAT
jgi:hypothetical protein